MFETCLRTSGALLAFLGTLAVAAEARAESSPVDEGTPRDGTISGGYIAMDLGLITLKESTRRRVEAGAGPAVEFRLGMEFWDVMLVGIGAGFGQPNDHAPFSEQVVDCTSVGSTVVSCGDTPSAQSSVVKAPFWNLELGAQHRFRPWVSSSFSLGGFLGQSLGIGSMVREVNCSGCRAVHLDGSAAGTYLAPFVRVSFGHTGYFAVVARSAWFLTGDLQQLTMVGGEFGLP